MHLQAVVGGQFCRQFINREAGPVGDPTLHPILDLQELATPWIALRLWRKRPGLTFEPHHVVDELDRDAQPPRSFGMRIALLHQSHGTRAQLNRMWLTHLTTPISASMAGNHETTSLGIPNPV